MDYKAASSSTWIIAATATTSTSINLTGLTAATVYDWRVRINCAAGTGNYVQAQFTTATPPVTCPGIYDISTNGTTSGAALIPFNTDIKGTVDASGDNDYYKFVISTGGTITMTLTTLPANYHLRLLNSSGSTLQTSNNSGTSNETITRTMTPGTYYARVYPSNNSNWNATSCYTLKVQLGTATRIETGEFVEAGSKRIVVFPDPVGYIANFSFTAQENGKADITVISQYGAVVLARSVSVYEGENTYKLDLSKLSNGMYFVKIRNGNETQTAKMVIAK